PIRVAPQLLGEAKEPKRRAVVGLDDLGAQRLAEALGQAARGGGIVGAEVPGLDPCSDRDEGATAPEGAGSIEDEPDRKEREGGVGVSRLGGEEHARGTGPDRLRGGLGLRPALGKDRDRAAAAERVGRGREELAVLLRIVAGLLTPMDREPADR